ncbi:Ohr family peroxiredoxin [Gemmatimonas groenlandica]|uniref:Ohr family peroxiredoxin n=1 Tax=Gemmatimonas groenlandica TaxID=2732249 RepID=A0A6M4ITT2_9BACT|nr:Ohr family peroxiredoxin [Gemmatimonas groenlandica]QJR37615.1 Ohr family peroxiredoxin [Gemmatimonas groenlandica]
MSHINVSELDTTALFSIAATATGGRDGRIATADGRLESRLAFPPELGGDGNGLSPEHLFAAGHAACFASSVKVAAQHAGVRVSTVRVTATVTVQRESSGAFRLRSALEVDAPELPPAQAAAIIEATHGICMYSRALAGHADVTATWLAPAV